MRHRLLPVDLIELRLGLRAVEDRVERCGVLLGDPFAPDGYGFQIELVSRAHRLGYAVGEAPITFRERVYGESKISRSIVAEALWKVTRWGWDLRFHTRQPA